MLEGKAKKAGADYLRILDVTGGSFGSSAMVEGEIYKTAEGETSENQPKKSFLGKIFGKIYKTKQ